jgi:hypothetical protein
MKIQRVWILLVVLAFFDMGTVIAEAFTNPLQTTSPKEGWFGPRWTLKASFSKPRNCRTCNHGRYRSGIVGLSGGMVPTPSSPTLLQEMIAELIGTFLIVQIGTGSVMSAIFTNSLVGLFQIASVWIIAVTIAICTTASISGAHLNPAAGFNCDGAVAAVKVLWLEEGNTLQLCSARRRSVGQFCKFGVVR